MKFPRYAQQDTTLQLLILPVFVFLLNWILLDRFYWQDWRVFSLATLTAGLLSYACWLVNNAIGLYAHRRFPQYRQSLLRVAFLIGWCLLSGFTSIALLYGIYLLADSPTFPLHPNRLIWAWVYDLVIVLVVISLYEGVIGFNHWQQSLRETEQLKKIHLQSKLEALKNKINPHFLFNSLNSLSALIEEDPAQAEAFVDEMSRVYRYLLRSNETELVSLATELAFVKSYFHLLSTRYGEHLRLELAVDPRCQDRQLPPLTLQLLLENAVKHNVILPRQPLTISIATQADRLVVRNKLQRKTGRILSNQVGLANITTQYRLLGADGVEVIDDGEYFTVSLPLIG